MKKIVSISLLLVWVHFTGYSQKNVRTKLVIPRNFISLSFAETEDPSAHLSFSKLISVPRPGNKFLAFISSLPSIKLKETGSKKPSRFFTELSFPDIFDRILNKDGNGMINTYDNDLPELFKDAPNAVKLKWIISL